MQNEKSSNNWFLLAPVTMVLIGINILVYIIQILINGAAINPSAEILLNRGGNIAMLSLTGDWWRLLSSIVVHAGIVHLLANSYALLLLGLYVERMYGKLRLIFVYVLGGVFASLVSALWNSHPQVVSVGASGAIMALCGALVAAAIIARMRSQGAPMSPSEKGLVSLLIQVIVLTLLLGFMVKGIDQAAHLGGLFSGICIGIVIFLVRQVRRGRQILLALIIGTAIAVVVWTVNVSSDNGRLLKYRQNYEAQKQQLHR